METPHRAPEWVAEHEIGPERAAQLIATQFPDLAGGSVEPLAAGWDNTVYLVGDEWVFRFPRRAIALAGVQHEIAVLPAVAPLVPLPVPVPELIGAAAGDYPWPFWGGRHVPGTELAVWGPTAPARESVEPQLATAVGGFLRVLHDPATRAAVTESLPVDPLHRCDPSAVANRARPRLSRLEEAGLWCASAGADLLSAADQVKTLTLAGPGRDERTDGLALVHGDLHLRHVLVDADGAAAGVIDWGDCCLADPAVDLSIAYGAFAGAERAALLAAYGPITLAQELAARVLALFMCAALAEHAAGVGDAPRLASALAGLARAVGD